MNQRHIIVLIAACLVTASCSERLKSDADSRIGLRAAISEMELTTRAAITAEAYRGTIPSATRPLNADVWFSSDSGIYEDRSNPDETTPPCRSTANFVSGDVTYPADDVQFVDTDTPAYCVGLYPLGAWSANIDGTGASCAIDGTHDIMFAPEVSGNWSARMTPMTFYHQLTWIKVCVCAYDFDAITSWGAVTEISIENPSDALTVDFSTGAVSQTGSSETLTAFDGSCTLKIVSQMTGSLFCAPATSYSVTVKSESMPAGKTVTVPLENIDGTTPTVENVTGKVYVLTLHFHSLTMIEATCTLADWEDEYISVMGS